MKEYHAKYDCDVIVGLIVDQATFVMPTIYDGARQIILSHLENLVQRLAFGSSMEYQYS